MSYDTREIDATFYQLIHSLVGSQQEDEDGPAERRACWRYPYTTIQRIAPHRAATAGLPGVTPPWKALLPAGLPRHLPHNGVRKTPVRQPGFFCLSLGLAC